jgi:hypothetical protein
MRIGGYAVDNSVIAVERGTDQAIPSAFLEHWLIASDCGRE